MKHREPIGCEYGYPTLCGKPAVYMCTDKHYPYEMPACEEHAPLMHGYPTPPPKCTTYYKVVEDAPSPDARRKENE